MNKENILTKMCKFNKIINHKGTLTHLWKRKVAKPESKTVTCSNDSSAATTG